MFWHCFYCLLFSWEAGVGSVKWTAKQVGDFTGCELKMKTAQVEREFSSFSFKDMKNEEKQVLDRNSQTKVRM